MTRARRAAIVTFVSSVAQAAVSPVQTRVHALSLEHHAVLELATADDTATGVARVCALIRRSCGAARVECWATGANGGPELVAAAGDGDGRHREVSLGGGAVLVILGGDMDPRLESALAPLGSILRRRRAEDRLAQTAIQLARRNEALEDFAALVAHELKAPLHAALVAPDASDSLEEALDLVDALLEAARNEASERTFASAADALELAARDLRSRAEITAELSGMLPLPPEPLRVLLRNLLSNAVSAGAQHIHVTSARSPNAWQLFVDDDGVGLADVERYAGGSGVGLSLCRRIAARFGGALELAPRPSGGTRATLVLAEAAQ